MNQKQPSGCGNHKPAAVLEISSLKERNRRGGCRKILKRKKPQSTLEKLFLVLFEPLWFKAFMLFATPFAGMTGG